VKPEVIFFDIGHTLVTGAELSPRRILGSRLGLSEKETKLIGQLIMTHNCGDPASLLAAMRDVLPYRHPAEIERVLEAVWAEQIVCVREIQGATLLLKSLRAEGFRLGIISNIWHPFYQGFCETCRDLQQIVDHELLSYRMGCKKPSPDLYREAVTRSGRPADACWMVGDSYELDIRPAMETGMNTIWVLSRPEKEKQVLAEIIRGETRPPTWAAEDLEEVYPFLLRRGREQ
jgi:HAD superfamily hydrolase (TIGR01549 family)